MWSKATALKAAGIHLGFRGDQLLDHSAEAVSSRPMQRRVASGVVERFLDQFQNNCGGYDWL